MIYGSEDRIDREPRGRVLALDIGEKRVGAAVSDESRTIATQSFLLESADIKGECARLLDLIERFDIKRIVIGNPLLLKGETGEQSKRIIAVKKDLEARVQIPIVLWDERLTTRSAHKALIEAGVKRRKRKLLVDKVSALLILQSYLDSRQRDE